MSDRHFALPIAFAAALHGALLFGFSESSHPAPIARLPSEPTRWIQVAPPDDEPLPIPETTEESGPTAKLEAPTAIAGPEPVPVESTSTFTISPPLVPTVDVSNLDRVPLIRTTSVGDRPWIGPVVDGTLLDNSPQTRLQSASLYPSQARREGLHGDVLVEFIVDETGRVLEPRVVRSTHRLFEAASLAAVAKWKFEPGRRDGRVVRFRMAVPVVFSLTE